ncbi:MAG: DUF3168 domain-containing protein [Lachnospiraceae bacterium]|nr:DUF3168 domain-containing protein [Lachnospiraceae bacterium]
MMKTAEQAIHDILWKTLSSMVDGNIYEVRPMNEVGYPFVDFEDLQTNYSGTKSGAISNVSANLNIWDTEDNRKNVSDICGSIFELSSCLNEAYGFKVSLRVQDSSIRIIQDRTVTPPVWRGMVNLVFDIL